MQNWPPAQHKQLARNGLAQIVNFIAQISTAFSVNPIEKRLLLFCHFSLKSIVFNKTFLMQRVL